MATLIGKRKREEAQGEHDPFKKAAAIPAVVNGKNSSNTSQPKPKKAVVSQDEVSSDIAPSHGHVPLQIVTGSYERVLHGITATIPSKLLNTTRSGQPHSEIDNTPDEDVKFSDTFLFAAHASSIKCLAISPPSDSSKRILATGGSDERINLYHLSTTPPSTNFQKSLPSLATPSTTENPRNRSLGNLIHHDRAVTSLTFPTKSKLFSAAEDNTIAISRTRDWTVLSSIKAPIPKPQGRPSGDTAGPGEVPAGINAFAVHPSQKLMLSVSRGERCMRLWNLMTGKKAGVLNSDRNLLAQVGEGKYGGGEGRRVVWDGKGEAFVVGFERGGVVFGIDSMARAVIRPEPATKLHQIRFLTTASEDKLGNVLAVSTEDGRILFYNVRIPSEEADPQKLPSAPQIAQLGGRTAGIDGRIKDFEVLRIPRTADDEDSPLLIVTGGSDGTVRLWTLSSSEVEKSTDQSSDGQEAINGKINGAGKTGRQVGDLVGALETGNRITCLGAFLMDGKTRVDDERVELDGEEEDDVGESESQGSE